MLYFFISSSSYLIMPSGKPPKLSSNSFMNVTFESLVVMCPYYHHSCGIDSQLVIFLSLFLFLRYRDRARAERERERETDLKAGSRLRSVSTEPDAGFELTNCEIMTWAEVGGLTDWATRVPQLTFLYAYIYFLLLQKTLKYAFFFYTSFYLYQIIF